MIDDNIHVIKGEAQRGESTASPVGDLLLDSSLIITTNRLSTYNVKLIDCNNYIQVYIMNNDCVHTDKNMEPQQKKKNSCNIEKIDTDNLNKINSNNAKTIELKNIIRSKLECQRLAKCNSNEWKTFITLTFAENIEDIKTANKRFRYFIDKVQRVYKDLKYICIPEFQKRGAVHYHLLTNIDINNTDLIYSQKDNKKFKHIKYWNDGFTKVDNLEKDIKKIVGYISKYMTKDIDNRLYNHRRYFYSRNLIKPTTNYLNLSNPKHLKYYMKKINDKSLIYNNSYINPYNQELIQFNEFM